MRQSFERIFAENKITLKIDCVDKKARKAPINDQILPL